MKHSIQKTIIAGANYSKEALIVNDAIHALWDAVFFVVFPLTL